MKSPYPTAGSRVHSSYLHNTYSRDSDRQSKPIHIFLFLFRCPHHLLYSSQHILLRTASIPPDTDRTEPFSSVLHFQSFTLSHHFTVTVHVAFFPDFSVTVMTDFPFFLPVILYLFALAFFTVAIFVLPDFTDATLSPFASLEIVSVKDFFALMVFLVTDSLMVGDNFLMLPFFVFPQTVQV